jgi:cytochrome c553
VDCGFVTFDICGSTDVDGDFNVNLVGNTVPDAGGFGGAFCTTPDCVASAQASLGSCTLAAGDNCAVPVPFSAATDGRDHWLSAGEAHCADCHAAPYTEQSGNIDAFPPFNYPRKASLMRYSRGHQDITCQGCHESIHGLYPVTPSIDNTSYAQAAALNHDGSHGPLKCGACHDVGGDGIPTFLRTGTGNVYGITDFDSAVTWAHTYTEQASVLDTTCQNCHGVQGANWSDVGPNNETYMRHAMRNPPRGSRQMMDKAETELFGAPISNAGNNATQDNGTGGMCGTCHGNEGGNVSCTDNTWLDHLTEGRISEEAFVKVSLFRTGSTCGW